jgi:hypothetical protein
MPHLSAALLKALPEAQVRLVAAPVVHLGRLVKEAEPAWQQREPAQQRTALFKFTVMQGASDMRCCQENPTRHRQCQCDYYSC